jgi:hypothetical protein
LRFVLAILLAGAGLITAVVLAADWRLIRSEYPDLRIEKPPSIANNALGFAGAVLAVPFAGDFYQVARKNPEGFEGLLWLWELELLGLRFILGAPAGRGADSWKPLPPGRAQFVHADVLKKEEDELRGLVHEEPVLVALRSRGGATSRGRSPNRSPWLKHGVRAMALRKEDMRAPAPLPGWKGRIPEREDAVQTILEDVQVRVGDG